MDPKDNIKPVAEADTTVLPVVTDTDAPVEEKTDAPKKRAKAKKSVPNGQVHIQASFNNTIVTVSDRQGNVLSSYSSGQAGFKGSKKGTAYAAQVASEKAVTLAKQNAGLSHVDVFVKGIGLGRDAAIRALLNADVMVDSIKDVTGVAHGGIRPKSPRKG